MKNKFGVIFLFMSLFLFEGLRSFSVGQDVQVNGIFSDLNFNEDSGDLIGTEVFIFYGGNKVLYQHAEGEPYSVLVDGKVDGDAIEFTLPRRVDIDTPSKTFKGKITTTNLVGRFIGENQELKLPRRKSYWL